MDSLVDTYTTFGSFYDRMLADVNAARQRVYVQFFKYEPDALGQQLEIGVYHPGFLHSKILVSDDRIGVVSSCNIDPRSYCLCQEVATVVDDAAFAASLRDVFLTDEKQSTNIDPDQWQHRPIWQRLKENICNIISSQL